MSSRKSQSAAAAAAVPVQPNYRPMDTFKIGDKAVYPSHGVAEVVAIKEMDFGGQKQTVYELMILENGMKVYVPTSNVSSVKLREIISEKEVEQVFAILKNRKEKAVDSTTWNRRYREYMEKIKTGSVFEIAEVLRDLYLLKGDKDLSFGERKMLDTARSLLIKELAFAKGVTEADIEGDLKKIFNIPENPPKMSEITEKPDKKKKDDKKAAAVAAPADE